jgi:hypothetical protein
MPGFTTVVNHQTGASTPSFLHPSGNVTPFRFAHRFPTARLAESI